MERESGFGSPGGILVTEPLGAADLRTADDAASSVHASLDLDRTTAAIAAVFAPRYAAAAAVRIVADTALLGPGASAGDLVVPLRVGGKTVGAVVLSEPTSAGSPELFERLAEHCARALANARRFEEERHVALTFQNAALASELPNSPAYGFDALYRAGRSEALVGGDWYDAFRLADGRMVISIGDVVGSGLDAAIAMVNVRQTLRGVAQVHPDPVMMLEAAGRTLREQHHDRFVTAFVGVMDPVTQECTYANAGHPAPYLRLADGTLRAARGRSIPLGLDFPARIEVGHIPLPPGSLFVLYTDGLIESTRDVLQGEDRLEAVLRDPDLVAAERPAARIHDAVVGDPGGDDVALLVVSVRDGPAVQRWRFDPVWSDAAVRARRDVVALVAQLGYTSPELQVDVELVYAELVGNAIRYAPGTVEVILEPQAGRIVLHILDKGPGFQFNPRLPADLYSECGRGLFLVSQFAAEFRVERRPGGGSHSRAAFTASTKGRAS